MKEQRECADLESNKQIQMDTSPEFRYNFFKHYITYN